MIRWWFSLWDQQEHARSLAIVRIALACVIGWDLLQMGWLGVVEPLYAPHEFGGLGKILAQRSPPWMYTLLPPTAVGSVVYGMAMVCTLCWGVGLLTPLAAIGLVVALTQMALAMPPADRGIDLLIRNMVLILAFSKSHRVFSIDARLWPRSPIIPNWPRRLVIVQLVLVYGTAGMAKVSAAWGPTGHFSALYVAMHNPAIGRVPSDWLPALFPFSQVLTAGTWLWEWSAPLLLLALHYRATRTRPGRLRALFNRLEFVRLYLVLGAVFHLGTAMTFALGIFPWAMLALYTAFVPPDRWAAWGRHRRD